MRFLIYLLLIGFLANGQERINEPLPVFTKKPAGTLKDDIMGWSYSLDGQWISADRTLMPRLISSNRSHYKDKRNALGHDNFKEFQIYPVKYGSDTLIMLVKIFTDGNYKYEATQKGWNTFSNAYYFLFDQKELRKLKALEDSTLQRIDLKLLDARLIRNTSGSGVLDVIKKKVRVNEGFERNMVIMFQSYEKKNILRFQIFSQHEIFPDVEGVRMDFTLEGETLYGADNYFDFSYYETSFDGFKQFFALPEIYEFEDE